MKYTIIPSIIARDQRELTARLKKVNGLSPIVQLDVMDGRFVPNTSLCFGFRLPRESDYEAHLMILHPERWIKRWGKRMKRIIVHLESCPNPERIIRLVHGMHRHIGLALNPETPVKRVVPYLSQIEEVVIMTVRPGSYGRPFLPQVLKKVREIRRCSPAMLIEVDGGVTPHTIGRAKQWGANLFISGSYLQSAKNPQKTFSLLKKKLLSST